MASAAVATDTPRASSSAGVPTGAEAPGPPWLLASLFVIDRRFGRHDSTGQFTRSHPRALTCDLRFVTEAPFGAFADSTARTLAETVDALAAVEADHATGPARQKAQRLRDTLDRTEGELRQQADAARAALGKARAALAEGADPKPAEDAYRAAAAEQAVLENRVAALKELAGVADRDAEADLCRAMEAEHKRRLVAAVTEYERLADELTALVGGRLAELHRLGTLLSALEQHEPASLVRLGGRLMNTPLLILRRA